MWFGVQEFLFPKLYPLPPNLLKLYLNLYIFLEIINADWFMWFLEQWEERHDGRIKNRRRAKSETKLYRFIRVFQFSICVAKWVEIVLVNHFIKHCVSHQCCNLILNNFIIQILMFKKISVKEIFFFLTLLMFQYIFYLIMSKSFLNYTCCLDYTR